MKEPMTPEELEKFIHRELRSLPPRKAPAGFAPLAIGLTLTLIHLVSIPVTNTSVNPARSTGVALFAQTGALGQLWLFWVAPILGAILGAMVWKSLFEDREQPLGAVPAE